MSKPILSAQIVNAAFVSALVFAGCPADAASRKPKAIAPNATPQVAPQSNDDSAAAVAVARAAAQPFKVVLQPAAIGWIKRCANPTDAQLCSVEGSFVVDPTADPVMAVSFSLLPIADTHLVQVLLPLGLKLRSGFALSLGGDDAYLGAFDRCQAAGCLGDVVVSNATFDTLMKAEKLTVVFSNGEGRSVSLEGSLAGMAPVAAGASITTEELQSRQKDAFEKQQAAIKDYQAKLQAEKLKRDGVGPSSNSAMAPPSVSAEAPKK